MKDAGPAVANLELSGIIRPDVVTEEIDAVNTALRGARYANTSGVASDAQAFTTGEAKITLANDEAVPLTISGSFAAHEQLVADPAQFAAALDPGDSRDVTVSVKSAEPIDLAELRPLTLNLKATWQPEGRAPITVPASRQIDVHGTHEGPELITNGRFDDTAQPWFTWLHDPDIGTVAFGDGEIRAMLKDPEFPWSAGMGQYVRTLRPGGRYRLSFRAANSGGNGIVHCQVGIDGQEAPLYLTSDGRRTQAREVRVGEDMASYTIEFVLPRDADLSTAKLILLLGDLRDARIDDVSLHEVTGAPVVVE
jgi:hypothetical protein